MKNICVLTLLALLPSVGFAANIQISAVKKTEDQRISSKQQLPGGSTQIKNSSLFYRFDVKCMDTQVPARAELQYVILLEEKNGNLKPGAWGREPIDLIFGQAVSVESDTVDVSERTWSKDHGSGKLRSKVYGYGSRIVDEKGDVLAEKFSKPSVEKYLIDLIDQRKKESEPPSSRALERRPRPHRPMRPPIRTP